MATDVDDGEPCEFCNCTRWTITATMIACKGCGALYGRVNGSWVLDPDSVQARAAKTETKGAETP